MLFADKNTSLLSYDFVHNLNWYDQSIFGSGSLSTENIKPTIVLLHYGKTRMRVVR